MTHPAVRRLEAFTVFSLAALAVTGCTITQKDGTPFGDPTNSEPIFTYQGVYDYPNVPIVMEVQDGPGGAWLQVPGASAFSSATGDKRSVDSNFYYLWTIQAAPVSAAAAAKRWPQGGLARVRFFANDPSHHGTHFILPIADENSMDCYSAHSGEDWLSIAIACGRDGGRGTALVSVTPTPADSFAGHTITPWLMKSHIPSFPANSVTQGNETNAYYAKINAPPDLATFRNTYGFNVRGAEVTATYYNDGDLGIGREMHCAQKTGVFGIITSIACYVRNFAPKNPSVSASNPAPVLFGQPNDAMNLALAYAADPTNPLNKPFATVAMVYTPSIKSPNSVKFMVYDSNDVLTAKAAYLDSKGSNTSIPSNCVTCHGGSADWDNVNKTITGAHFLPFDVFNALKFGTGYANDPETFRKLNLMVKNAGATPAISELIDGMYNNNVAVAGTVPVDTYVPPTWSSAGDDTAGLYKTMIAPYCRNCHAAQADVANNLHTGFDFTDYTSFRALESTDSTGGLLTADLCSSHVMPNAEHVMKNFWASPARAHLTRLFKMNTACDPK